MIDTGVKRSIVENLRSRGAEVTLHPCTATAQQLLQSSSDAIFLANRPANPGALDYIVATVRELVGKLPVYGICLGHQLLCRAVGLETYKLPFGHHGANHPGQGPDQRVRPRSPARTTGSPCSDRRRADDRRRRAGPLADRSATPQLSHINLDDRTVEGLRLLDVPGATVQYHPEAGPGPARRDVPIRPASWSEITAAA